MPNAFARTIHRAALMVSLRGVASTHSLFRERRRFILTLIAPAVLVLLAFEIIPILMGVDVSLRKYGLTELERPFVGLRNYRKILFDTQFYRVVLPNTFLFMVATVASGTVFGLSVAMLINRPFRGQHIVRTVIVFPLMVAPVVASIMIAWIFNDQFGIANVILTGLGFPAVAWLVHPWVSFGIVIMTDIWLWTPFYVLIILAALQTLPQAPHEAARVDGANEWLVFRLVTLPLLRPVLLVIIVIRSIDAFRVFDVVWTITKGEPGRLTEVFSIYAYKESFIFLNFGVGTAASLLGGVIIMGVGATLYFSLYRLSEVSR
jgi:multiple sugar transport system permease protein